MARKPAALAPPKTAGEMPLSAIQEAIRRKSGAGASPYTRLRDFVVAAWPTVEGVRPYLPNWHMDAKCEHLEAVSRGEIRKLVITEPPGHGKSLVVSVCWPAWHWGPYGHPDARFLCVAHSGGTDTSPAIRDADRCRDLINSQFYRSGWGTVFSLSETQNSKQSFKNTAQGHRISTGLDGQTTGQRADFILIDDPTSLQETSLDAILKPSDVYERELRSRLDPAGDDSAIVLIMQRLHPDDLAGYFLKQDGWVHLNLPMFYEAERKCRVFLGTKLFFEDPREVEGSPLHPMLTSAVDTANAQRRNRPDVFEAQYQQRPSMLKGQIIQRIDHWTRDTLPNHFDEVIMTVDCAFKGKEEGKKAEETKRSFVVFQKWGRKGALAYLLDQVRDHMELPETCDALVEFCGRRPHMAGAKYVEAKANGVGVVQVLRNAVPGLMTTDDDEDVLKEFCKGSKDAKLQAVAAYFKAGQVLVPDDAPWVPEYEHELRAFPQSRFNDQVDATSMAVWRLLHTFEAHVSAAEVMTPDAGNVGLVAGVFDKAYADVEKAGGVAATFHGAYGGFGVSDLGRKAFGS